MCIFFYITIYFTRCSYHCTKYALPPSITFMILVCSLVLIRSSTSSELLCVVTPILFDTLLLHLLLSKSQESMPAHKALQICTLQCQQKREKRKPQTQSAALLHTIQRSSRCMVISISPPSKALCGAHLVSTVLFTGNGHASTSKDGSHLLALESRKTFLCLWPLFSVFHFVSCCYLCLRAWPRTEPSMGVNSGIIS